MIPVLNGLFGWLIIDMIVSFLFNPYEKKNLFFFKVQGLIPSLQQSLAEELGQYVAEYFVNFKELENKLLSTENLSEIHNYLDKKAEDFLRNKLTEKLPILSMFITDSLISTAKESLVGELDKIIPEIISMYSGKIQEQLNIKQKVAGFIRNYPIRDLENKFHSATSKKILTLKIAVSVIGVLIGIFEVGVLIIR
jgi:uncharacterized membrane protein YheB (UPF0754 family)